MAEENKKTISSIIYGNDEYEFIDQTKYTKEEVDERINNIDISKTNIGEQIYSKDEINNIINNIDVSDRVYTKNQVYTKDETDERINEKIGDIDITEIVGRPTGIPIYTQEKLEEDKNKGLNINDNEVIMIDNLDSSGHDASQIPSSPTYNYTGNDTYLDILFSTIRALQTEVAKLKNSFNYGIESYNGKQTATSTEISEYEVEQEPLWAIDEYSLSPIADENFVLSLDEDHLLVPKENVETHNGFLKILDDVTFNVDSNLLNTVAYKDNKIFLYLTTSNLNFDVKFKDIDSDNIITLNFAQLCNIHDNQKFNVLIVVNKQLEDVETHELSGKNYIYVSVNDYIEDNINIQGYYNGQGLDSDEPQFLDTRYIFNDIKFYAPFTLYKFNMYSRQDNFYGTESINIEETPSEKSYKYKAAHITVRVIDTLAEANEIKSQLLEGEPLYIKDQNGLYIIIDGKIKTIGSANTTPGEGGESGNQGDDNQNNQNTGMTQEEIIELLRKNGIINIDENGEHNLQFNDIADITFINQNTGKRFKFEVDNEGELHSTELTENDIATRVENIGLDLSTPAELSNYRGFIGCLHGKESGKAINALNDFAINSDRLKIGAIYSPNQNQKVFGCSHAYIELENTSDKDINLDDFYIHYARQNDDDQLVLSSLKLSGYIPAGGTYLIRGKQYSSFDQANTYIKVKTYDIEWYVDMVRNGETVVDENNNPVQELIDLTWKIGKKHTYLLTYGLPENFSCETKMVGKKDIVTQNNDGTQSTTYYRVYHPRFVDVISIANPMTIQIGGATEWTWYRSAWKYFVPPTKNGKYLDVIFRNTFMLDPAKQAYQSLEAETLSDETGKTMKDSSRARNNTATDYQYLALNTDKISFPKSNEKYDVAKFTPKASFEHKNVCTDKTELNIEKPNAVTVSFGINMNTTRCFNWVSGGYFDEFVWIRKKGTTNWKQFESYHDSTTGLNEDPGYEQDSIYPRRKKFGYFENKTTGTWDSVESVVYDRLTNIFPGCKTAYTSHKCIIDVVSEAVSEPEVWEYIVGRENPNHTPDENHTSNIQTFTLYPSTYTPRIFQTTDQQGFHWVEYQQWAAAANKVNQVINEQLENEQIVPVLVNTGDMTQNGSRVNEWLDYYNAGISLFNHIEQMNVVGNNDLCSSTDVTELGTGDDGNGKTNAYYFHVFYCYEIDPEIMPIISNANATKYIPSFYYFGNGEYNFVMINSEINVGNCQNWFKQILNDRVVNVYTGWQIKNKAEATDTSVVLEYDNSFKTVYTMIYEILNKINPTKERTNKCIVACHEMPFTVVTNSNLSVPKNLEKINRSISDKSDGNLVGSHTNLLGYLDKKSNYWFSRLLEYFGIKLIIGGHKHTYACTNPLRELYSYQENGETKYSIDGKMNMESTLENDTVNFDLYYKDGQLYDTNIEGSTLIQSSKFPIMQSSTSGINKSSDESVWYPYFGVDTLNDGVIYFMCQATGYKLKSNKELPSPDQRFSYVIPKTKPATVAGKTDTPSNDQLYSMFSEIDLNQDNITIYLYRILNITTVKDNKPQELTQINYNSKDFKLGFLTRPNNNSVGDMYGQWNDEVTTKQSLITL